MDLANYWYRVPELENMGVLEVFYGHLDASEAPSDSEVSDLPALNQANMSLAGLSHLGILADDEAGRQATERLLKSWPGESASGCGGSLVTYGIRSGLQVYSNGHATCSRSRSSPQRRNPRTAGQQWM